MNDQKLKIRIQLAQQTKPIDELYPETENQEEPDKPPFDRQKILLALSALLLTGFIIGLISYFIFYWNGTEQPKTEADPVITTQENIAPPVDAQLDKPTKFDLTSEPDITNTANLALNPDESTIAPPVDIQHDKPTVSKADDETVNLSLSANEIYVDPVPAEKPTKTDLTSVADATNTANLTEKPDEEAANALTNNTLEDQPQVIRAQLTSAIHQREPTDRIDYVQLDQGNTDQIFFFMQLRNLMGQRVSVHWHHQDKVVAKVPLMIGSRNWRTYASKLLNKTGLGAWHVTLYDQSGKLLSQRSFTVGDRP